MKIETRDHQSLNYQHFGPENGQPLVFIHGFGGYQQIWHFQAQTFADQGYSVYTYDQRGHGASSPAPDLDDIGVLIADLADFLAALKVENPILVGHSMGASVIYGFLKLFPQVPVRAIVAVDQSPKMLNTPKWPYGYRTATRANYRQVLLDNRSVRETYRGVPDELKWALAPVKELFPFDRADHQALLFDHARRDWRKPLLATTVPTLLVTAKESPYFKPAFATTLAAANPAIETACIDSCGHVVIGEQPAAFNRQLTAFLKAHDF